MTFAELMAQQGVTRNDLLQKTRQPPPPRPPGQEPTTSTQRTEIQQLLDNIHGLRQQRDTLRGQLQQQEQRLQALTEARALDQIKLREMEALRRSDMEMLSKLRRELESMTDRCRSATRERDALRRRSNTPSPPTPAPLPTPSIDSDIQQAAHDVLVACDALEISKLTIVGGAPPYHKQLTSLLTPHISLRIIPGNERRNAKQAKTDLAWADITILWGGSILDHSISQLYKGSSVITIANRGIVGMLRELSNTLT